MSVLDRVNRQRAQTTRLALTEAGSEADGQSSTLAVKSPVVARLQVVMRTLNDSVINSGQHDLAKFAFLLQAITDEVILELTDREDAPLGTYFEMMGEVVAWIGHGDDERLPERLREFAEQPKEPIPVEA